jgi:hypothetical protein
MKLAEALLEATQCLRAMNRTFAVVGGLAASARGEVRFTRDIDVVVEVDNASDAEGCIFGLGQRGYRVIATVEQDATGGLATARLGDANGVVFDVIFATSSNV